MTDAQTELVLTAKGPTWDELRAGRNMATGAIRLLTPAERAVRKGQDGATDAHKHLTDHAPAYVLEALGDALLAFRDAEFTAEDVRLVAERSDAVKGWLAVTGRENCYGGWFVSRVELHHLERTGAWRVAQRKQARGRPLPVWRFPLTSKGDAA